MMPCQTSVLPFLRFSMLILSPGQGPKMLGWAGPAPSRNHAAALADPRYEQGKWEKLKNPQRRRKSVNQNTTKWNQRGRALLGNMTWDTGQKWVQEEGKGKRNENEIVRIRDPHTPLLGKVWWLVPGWAGVGTLQQAHLRLENTSTHNTVHECS